MYYIKEDTVSIVVQYIVISKFSIMKHFSDHTEDLQTENKSSKLIELCRIMCKSVFLKDIIDNNRYDLRPF